MVSTELTAAGRAAGLLTHYSDANKGNLAGIIINGRLGVNNGRAAVCLCPSPKKTSLGDAVALQQRRIECQDALGTSGGSVGFNGNADIKAIPGIYCFDSR